MQRLEEKVSHQILNKALALERAIREFKEFSDKAVSEVLAAKVVQGTDSVEALSSFEFSCFDKSVVIKKDMAMVYQFNQEKLEKAKECLRQFVEERITSDMVRDLVNSVLKLDRTPTTSIIALLEPLVEKTNDELFIKGVSLLKEAVETKTPKSYIRVYIQEEDNSFRMINTSLSKS